MPPKKQPALPDNPLAKFGNDPMSLLYGDRAAEEPKPVKKEELPKVESQAMNQEIEELKRHLKETEERLQKAEEQSADLMKRLAILQGEVVKSFPDPYGSELERLLTTDQGHTTLRPTTIYSRVYTDVKRKIEDEVGVTMASPQFLGLASCAFECLLRSSNVNWEAEFKDLRGKVKPKSQGLLHSHLWNVLRRGIRPPSV